MFDSVCSNMKSLLKRRFALDVSTNLFSYVGGFLCYVIVGLAMHFGDALNNVWNRKVSFVFPCIKFLFQVTDPAEFAGMLQQASFLVIMLISGFSKIVDVSADVSVRMVFVLQNFFQFFFLFF